MNFNFELIFWNEPNIYYLESDSTRLGLTYLNLTGSGNNTRPNRWSPNLPFPSFPFIYESPNPLPSISGAGGGRKTVAGEVLIPGIDFALCVRRIVAEIVYIWIVLLLEGLFVGIIWF